MDLRDIFKNRITELGCDGKRVQGVENPDDSVFCSLDDRLNVILF